MKPRKPFAREIRRTRRLSAWINVQGRVYCECQVMDISKGGAKIITEESVPDRFQLAFFQGGQNRVCEVMWRRINTLGVKFIF
jgi:hypothetical protein